jgi:biopolymer transport protein ExbD
MAGSQNIGESSDNPVAINVTAMVDVIFCLCIFFMCSFHFKQLEGKIDTWLPKDRGIFQGAINNDLVKDEVRVVMRWDPRAKATIRKVANQNPVGSDEELMRDVLQIADGYNKVGNMSWPLVIDAAAEVPWQDVVHVMDLCKRNKIERIEFAAPSVPIQ